jgi:F420-dependent oxidoreductase-like protein
MQLGLQLPSFSWPEGPAALAATLRRIAATADEGGFASLWVMDHFFQIPIVGPAENEMLEGYTTLAFLAAATRRARLGTLVTGVTYRNPGVLVKTVSTLDVLSGGRAMLGIGAAWFEREHRGLGVPFPPLRERFERLEDALRIAKQMWSGKVAPFEGVHHRMAETLCVPQPLQRPHPPILIGGMGEKRTLRLVARYADACNLFAFAGAAEVGRKLEVLRRHCDAEKRDFEAIERTTLGSAQLAPGKQSPADVIRELRELAKAGVQHAIVNLPNVHEITPLETLAKEVIPAISEL